MNNTLFNTVTSNNSEFIALLESELTKLYKPVLLENINTIIEASKMISKMGKSLSTIDKDGKYNQYLEKMGALIYISISDAPLDAGISRIYATLDHNDFYDINQNDFFIKDVLQVHFERNDKTVWSFAFKNDHFEFNRFTVLKNSNDVTVELRIKPYNNTAFITLPKTHTNSFTKETMEACFMANKENIIFLEGDSTLHNNLSDYPEKFPDFLNVSRFIQYGMPLVEVEGYIFENKALNNDKKEFVALQTDLVWNYNEDLRINIHDYKEIKQPEQTLLEKFKKLIKQKIKL